jgi:hypothetical protein
MVVTPYVCMMLETCRWLALIKTGPSLAFFLLYPAWHLTYPASTFVEIYNTTKAIKLHWRIITLVRVILLGLIMTIVVV